MSIAGRYVPSAKPQLLLNPDEIGEGKLKGMNRYYGVFNCVTPIAFLTTKEMNL